MTTGSTTGFQSRYRFFKSHVPARRPMRSSARSNRPARSSFSPPYLRDHAPIFELNCKKRPSIQLLRSAGIEPTTVRLEGGCAIQLSYERATTILSHHGEIRKAMIPQRGEAATKHHIAAGFAGGNRPPKTRCAELGILRRSRRILTDCGASTTAPLPAKPVCPGYRRAAPE